MLPYLVRKRTLPLISRICPDWSCVHMTIYYIRNVDDKMHKYERISRPIIPLVSNNNEAYPGLPGFRYQEAKSQSLYNRQSNRPNTTR